MIIRVILIAFALAGVVVALRGTGSSKQLAVRRVALLSFTGAWILAVLFPNSLTTVANVVGVGRGTDLLLYAFVVAVSLGAIGVYQRFTRLEAKLVTLTRELAIMSAERSGEQATGRPGAPDLRLAPPVAEQASKLA